MSLYLALRRARHLSTVASAAVTADASATVTAASPLNISGAKKRLKSNYGPDEALRVYNSLIAANDAASASPSTARHIQELAVRRLAISRRFSDIEAFLESQKSQPQITEEPFVSSLIKSYGVAGMIENAVTTYNQMTEFGTPRSPYSFNTLLLACVHCKAYDRVPLYFDEFPQKYGFAPDKFSYGVLVKAHCEMDSPEKAMEILNEMEKKGAEIGAVSFTTILHALYKSGKVDEAEAFWDKMVNEKGVKIDAGSYNVKLSHVGKEPESVKALIEEMQNAGINPDAISFNYLITSYCVNGMMNEAEKVYLDLMQAKKVRANSATFRTMVFHLCKAGRYVRAYKVFKQSVKVGKIPDFNTLKYLIKGLVEMDRKVEAKAMVRTMNKKFPPDLIKAWGILVEELGLTREETKEGENGDGAEVEASEEAKGAGSDTETEKKAT